MVVSEYTVNLSDLEDSISQQIIEELTLDSIELDLSNLSLKVNYTVNVEIESIKVVNTNSHYDVNNEHEVKPE